MIYFILALLTTIIGAVVGIGGGLIIRPVLAALEISKGLASFTSSITVMSMALVTLINYKRKGAKFDMKTSYSMVAGSILGGFIGGSLLTLVSTNIVNIGYIAALVLVLAIAVMRNKMPRFHIKSPLAMGLIGIFTGILSGFFGIGGGPFQMAALLIFFSMEPKDAVVSSIFITLFTTASSLVRYSMNGYADFTLAVYMIPAAVVGGYLGSKLNRKMNNKQVSLLFNITVFAIIMLQLWTVFTD